jgi:hypothetical protein
MDQKTNVVCKPCNEGWMSDLEADARITLSGIIRDAAPVSLLPRGIASLSAFAFKCAVVANHMNPQDEPFFRPYMRHRFKDSRWIPDGVQMWVAAFQGEYRASGIFNAYYAKPTISPLNDLDLYVFTFAAGHLAFQVLALKWRHLHRAGDMFPIIAPEDYWQKAAVQFWPTSGTPVCWPPSQYLDDESVKAFQDRFSTMIKVAIA